MNSSKNQETHLDVIRNSARLSFPVTKILSVLSSKFPELDIDRVKNDLSTEGTPEFTAYRQGTDARDYDLENSLYKEAVAGDTDAHKLLKQKEEDKRIGDAIDETFFS